MKILVFCGYFSPSSCLRSLNLTGTNIKLIYGERGTCDILTHVCVMQHLNIRILKCYCFFMVKAKSFLAVFFLMYNELLPAIYSYFLLLSNCKYTDCTGLCLGII